MSGAGVVFQVGNICCTIFSNKTRQGYVRKHILKPAGYFFVGQDLAGVVTTKRPFGKPATTYAEQVAKLEQRGLVVKVSICLPMWQNNTNVNLHKIVYSPLVQELIFSLHS
jgi:hypothetical protein